LPYKETAFHILFSAISLQSCSIKIFLYIESSPKESIKMFIAFFDSFKISSGDKGSMFSIKYLYSIRNNFAIIYNGFDNTVKNKLLEKFKKIKTSENNIDLYIFMNDIEEKKEDKIFKNESFKDFEKLFARTLEIFTEDNIDILV
jgi:hypothetical protein